MFDKLWTCFGIKNSYWPIFLCCKIAKFWASDQAIWSHCSSTKVWNCFLLLLLLMSAPSPAFIFDILILIYCHFKRMASMEEKDARVKRCLNSSPYKKASNGQWLWLRWQSGPFQNQRFVVRIQSKIYIEHLFTVFGKTEIKRKRGREWPIYKTRRVRIISLVIIKYQCY